MTKMTFVPPDLHRDEIFEAWGTATAALFERALEQIDPEASLRVAAALEAGGSFALAATLDPPAVRGLLELPGAEPMTLFEIRAPDEGEAGQIH